MSSVSGDSLREGSAFKAHTVMKWKSNSGWSNSNDDAEVDNTEDRSVGSGDDKHTEGVGPDGLLDQVMQEKYNLSNSQTDEKPGGKAKFVLIETTLMAPMVALMVKSSLNIHLPACPKGAT